MKYITRKDIAEKLNITPNTVRQMEMRGTLPAERLKPQGNPVEYLLTPELETWLASNPAIKKDRRRDASAGFSNTEDVRMLREFLKPGLRYRRTHDADMCQIRSEEKKHEEIK